MCNVMCNVCTVNRVYETPVSRTITPTHPVLIPTCLCFPRNSLCNCIPNNTLGWLSYKALFFQLPEGTTWDQHPGAHAFNSVCICLWDCLFIGVLRLHVCLCGSTNVRVRVCVCVCVCVCVYFFGHNQL